MQWAKSLKQPEGYELLMHRQCPARLMVGQSWAKKRRHDAVWLWTRRILPTNFPLPLIRLFPKFLIRFFQFPLRFSRRYDTIETFDMEPPKQKKEKSYTVQ